MKTIEIKTQKEFDALPDRFKEFTRINIVGTETIIVTKAWGNSSVEAWENSSVVARENSSVVALGNSSVEARENSSVEARENSGIHLCSDFSVITLFGFAVCWALAKGKILKKSKTATIIKPESPKGVKDWLESQAIEIEKKSVVLFKRVSNELKTQEGTENETVWEIGKTIEHKNWSPKDSECGDGKFHACSRAYFCDEFRDLHGDRYVAIQIAVSDLYAWPNAEYPHKIAFRKGTVLYEVDRFGKKK